MFTKSQLQRTTWVLSMMTVLCIIAGYAAVAASTYMRPPTVVVTFNIEKVVTDLTEKADSEAKLRALIIKIQDEEKSRLESITVLQESIESAAEVDRSVLIEEVEQKSLEAMSYQRFARLRIDAERSLMLHDIYLKIKKAVADIAQENGYDIVLISDVNRNILVNPKSDISREAQVLEQIGSQRTVYISSEIDITEQIVTHMNLEWKKRTSN